MMRNPLKSSEGSPRGSARSIEDYCRWLNTLNWVHASGVPYVVGERTSQSGEVERFLDRGAA